MNKNPFPGLRPFEANETQLFFGRDGQSNELLRRLQNSRFLAVVGTSGSGKSSLVRAGLLPALEGGLMAGVESEWRIAITRPGNDPIGNLADALTMSDVLGLRTDASPSVESAIAETTLRRGSRGLIQFVAQARNKVRSDGRPMFGKRENLLIVVDQFEEIFRIIEQFDALVRVKQLSLTGKDPADTLAQLTSEAETDSDQRHPKEDAAAFVKLLLEATRKNENQEYEENIYVILTMRSDYLGDSAQFWDLPEAINEGEYLIPRMTRDQRRQAIVGPVAVSQGKIQERLVNQLLNDAGEDPDHLPTLQHALMRMWDLWAQAPGANGGGIGLKHYEAIGQIAGALSQHANEAFADLPEDLQPLAAKVFKCLTEKGLDNREGRRPMTLSDICAVTGRSEDDVKKVIEVFRADGRSFLMPPLGKPLQPDTLIDISHESLIRGWDKLKVWVDEEAESARTYKRLADTALLKEVDQEDFYRGPALQIALEWRRTNSPNETWARRYHPEFRKAIEFLDASLENSKKVEKADKERLENELRQANELVRVQEDASKRRSRYLLGLLLLTVLAGGSSAYAWKVQRRNTISQLDNQRLQLATQKQTLLQETERAKTEMRLKDDALRAEAEAQEARIQAQHEAERAEKLRKLADDRAVALATSLKNEKLAAKKVIDAQSTIAEQAKIYGYFKTAFEQIANGDREAAVKSLEQAKDYYAAKKDTPNLISTYINIADIYRVTYLNIDENERDGETEGDSAVENYEEALKLIRAQNDDKLLALTSEKAASVFATAKQPEQRQSAADYYEQAAGAYHRLSMKKEEAERFENAGTIFILAIDEASREAAQNSFRRALDVYKDPLDNKKLAETNIEIGDLYAAGSESDQAKEPAKAGNQTTEEEQANSDERAKSKEQQMKLTEQARTADWFRRAAARYYLDAARLYSEKVHDNEEAAKADIKAASVLAGSNDLTLKENGVEFFRRAADRYAQLNDKANQTSTLVAAGDVFSSAEDRGLWPRADQYYDQAAQVYRDAGDRANEASTWSAIGQSYSSSEDTGQKQKAATFHERAANIYRDLGNKQNEAAALIEAAAAVQDIPGAEAQSNDFYNRAVAAYDGDVPNQIATLIRIGRSLAFVADEAKAIRGAAFFDRAVALGESTGGKKAAASVYLDIGAAYLGRQKYAAAIEKYQRALTIYEEVNDAYGQGIALYRLASTSNLRSATRRDVDKYADRSIALLSGALPALEGSDNKRALADGYYALGYAQRLKKDNKTAYATLTKAYNLYMALPPSAELRRRQMVVKSVLSQVKRAVDRETPDEP